MKTWGTILLAVVGFTVFILLLALIYTLTVTWAAQQASRKTLKKNLRKLEDLLPGKDCGACGCKTCAEYANAVFTLCKDTDCCTQGDDDLPRKLDAQMDKFNKMLEDDTPKEEEWRYR